MIPCGIFCNLRAGVLYCQWKGVCQTVGGCPPRRVSDALREFIPVNLQGGLLMSIELLLTVASFAVSVFALGYMLGSSHKNQKWPPKLLTLSGHSDSFAWGLTVYRQRLFFALIIARSAKSCKKSLRELSSSALQGAGFSVAFVESFFVFGRQGTWRKRLTFKASNAPVFSYWEKF